MFINLFSVFDHQTSINYSINWLSLLFIILFLPYIFWFIPSRWNIVILIIIKILIDEFRVLLGNNKNLANILIILRIFYTIIISNLVGIFPYIFTLSRHLVFRLSFSLVLWISIILFGWIINTNHIFTHLVPQGTPGILMPFIVLIESIRNIIRPGTLAVRLSANIIAGHLLITLISSTGNSLSLILLIIILLCQRILIILELSVAFIQAYVFSLLRTLYRAESN